MDSFKIFDADVEVIPRALPATLQDAEEQNYGEDALMVRKRFQSYR
jgi:hypothetical protein